MSQSHNKLLLSMIINKLFNRICHIPLHLHKIFTEYHNIVIRLTSIRMLLETHGQFVCVQNECFGVTFSSTDAPVKYE